MKTRRNKLFALVAAPLLTGVVTGCALIVPWRQLYSGTGEYVSPGMSQVRVFQIPLDQNGSRCANLSHLGPDWNWTVGIRVEAIDGDTNRLYTPGGTKLLASYVPHANIELTLKNEADQNVFSVSGPLAEWNWNWNRAYREGRGEEYQSAPHTYSFRRFDVGPDDGWGSSFTPRFFGTYTLCYRIIEQAPVATGTVVWLTAETYWGSL